MAIRAGLAHCRMWKGEIRSFRRDQLGLKTRTLQLKSGDTEIGEGRVIPLNHALTTLFNSSTRYLKCA